MRLTVVVVADHGSITGGQAKVAIESAIGLKRAGLRVIFFCAADPVDPRLDEAGVEVVRLGQTDLLGASSRAGAMAQGTWNRKARLRLAETLRALPRERTVVHVHGWARALSPAIALPLRESRLPAVYTVHEYFLFCPNGGFYNYQTQESCALTPLSGACFATHCDQRSYARKLWRGARLQLARAVGLPTVFSDYLCISQMQRDILRDYLPSHARVTHAPNPIDALDLGPKTAPAKGDYLFVGRLSPEKGAHLFAQAAERAGVGATFVGDGPEAAALKSRFPQFRFLGWLDADRTREAMRSARALVFPSLWYEGQPLTVLEAKALGTPVIVADQCAGREEIANGEQGLWFKSADASDLARALTAMQDDGLARRLSGAAYADYWREPPTLARHVALLLRVYEQMLAAPAPARIDQPAPMR